MIRKADIILAVILIIGGLTASFALASGGGAGETVHVSVDGETYGYYSLLEDQQIDVKQDQHINKITIKDGYVSMSFSDCPNQDCVEHYAISGTSESIVCLPNKVVVEIRGGDSKFDAISN